MTTVVCNRSAMAADSFASDDHAVCSVKKIFRVRGGLLGIAGDLAEAMAFVAWFEKKSRKAPPPMENADALFLDKKGRIWCFDGHATPFEIKDDFAAIGSGAPAALGALHMGADLVRAIDVASRVDCGTGGPTVLADLC